MSATILIVTSAFAAAGAGFAFAKGCWRELQRVGMTLNYQGHLAERELGKPRHPARDALTGLFAGAALGLIGGIIVDTAPPREKTPHTTPQERTATTNNARPPVINVP